MRAAYPRRALASLAGEEAVKPLFAALVEEKYRDVADVIADALAGIPSLEARQGFYRILNSERTDPSRDERAGIGHYRRRRGLRRRLISAVHDSSAAVRKSVYHSLARIGLPDAADTVISGLKDLDDGVRLTVLKALGGWSGARLQTAVLESLKDDNMGKTPCGAAVGRDGGYGRRRACRGHA